MTTMYEDKCRRKFYELLDNYERVDGYSPSQVLSVMTVLNCHETDAMKLIDLTDKCGSLDWSEASWYETFIYFDDARKQMEKEENPE